MIINFFKDKSANIDSLQKIKAFLSDNSGECFWDCEIYDCLSSTSRRY